MKKLKLFLLFTLALTMCQVKSQSVINCSNAVLITQPHAQVYIGNTTFQWYKFDATSSNMRLNISEKSNQINISKIELYSGTCTSLTLLTKDSLTFNLDSVKTIQSSSITIGTSYFVKVSFINAQINNSYSFNLSSTLIPFCTFCITDYVTGLSLGCYAGCAIPIPTITICAGTTICIGFDCQLLAGSQTFTFSNGDPDVTVGPGFACGLYTPSTTGLITVGMPYYVAGDWPCTGDMLYINVLGATPPPLFSISPSNPICLSSCLTFSSLNIPSSITSYSFNAPGTFMTGPPSNCLKYSTPGSHIIEYILNPNQTCSVVATYTAVVLEPAVSFTMSSANCTLDRTFTAFDNCNSTSTFGATYDWYIYSGTSSAGTLLYSTTFGSNILSYTFPASGTYYVEVHSSLGGILGQIITITPTSPPVPSVITNTLLSLCNLPTDSLVTLNPNVVLGTSTAIWSAIDATTGLPLIIPFTMGVNGIITYNLSGFSTYTAPIIFCVKICDLRQCITIYPCCPTASGTVLYSNTIFTSSTTLAGPTKYHFSGVITINALVQISATEVTFDPNTKIIVKPNGTLEVFQSYLHGCSAMWDGIYLDHGCTLKIYQSNTIEDAKRAVVDTLGANFININSTWFNKNYESIVLKSANTTPNLFITNNLFSCDVLPGAYTTASPSTCYTLLPAAVGALAPTFMLPPYISRKSYSGITLYQTKTPTSPNQFVQITKYNLFDKLQFGIVATRSKFVVQYNTFQNITAGKGLYAAIYIYGRTGFLPYLPEAKIGGTPSQGNTFNNCTFGIYSQYGSILSVLNNTLTTIIRDGIFITKNRYDVVIDKNKLFQCLRGINLFDNIYIKADVTNNRIVNATTVGVYNNNFGIFIGEVVPATSTISGRCHNIYNNYIDGHYNGVYVTNTYSTQIVDNETHIRADNTPGNFQMGIRVEGTNKINIKNNIVDKPLADNSAWWQYGIFLNGNTIPAIKCNSINNFYASVKFQMLNYVAPGNGLTFNVFNNFYHGVWLDQNAEIGDQYATFPSFVHKASMNQWQGTGFFSQTYVTNHSNQNSTPSSGVASKIYTLPSTSGAYYLNNSFAFRDAFTTGLFTELKGAYSYPSLYIPCPTSIPTPLMFRSANIAVNNLTYGVNTSNLVHVSNRMLVKNIKTEGINLSLPTNAMYKNFIDSTYTKSVGQFYRVDSLLNLGMSTGSVAAISQAKLLNTSISSPNLLEQNQKWLNAIYIDMQTAEPDTSILLMLEQLAIKCPQYDGEAVYQARSILMYYFGKSYNSICDVQNIQPSGSRISNITDTDSSPLGRSGGASVYPNPTTKDITVTYTKGEDAEAAIFEVYNMVGELILNQTLNENITKLSLSDLSSGIYIYFIKQDGVTLQTNKLVLTK